jgi:hypothetical protein
VLRRDNVAGDGQLHYQLCKGMKKVRKS